MGWLEDFEAAGKRKISEAQSPQSAPAIGDWKTTVHASPNHGAGNRRYDRSIPANIRHNNPGATYPAGWMKKYGMDGVDTIGGGHLIANFPNAASGAAANFELMERQYAGKPLSYFIHKWSGGNSSGLYAAHVAKEVGISPNTVITRDMIRDPKFAPRLLKAQLSWESGKGSKAGFGLNDEHLSAAHSMYLNGNGQPVASAQPKFTQPQTVNNEGVVSTASSMLKSPPPATPGSGFANVAMNNNIISEAPMPMTAVPGQPTAPMPVVKPATSFASNMPVYGQTPPDKAVSGFNERTGTMMHPTAGREVLHMGGLTPEQQRDTLQGAFDRGNKDMLYVHDNNPRVVARPGDAKWAPGKDPKTAGPEFANTFQVANGYGTNPRPMADSNPLKGSRYDDGTATGTLPAPPAGMISAPPAPSPPTSATPIQAKSQPAIIAQAAPPTEAPPQPPPGPTEPPKSMIAQGPTSGRMALGAGDVQPVQPPPPPSGAPAPSTPQAQPQATGTTPAPQPANVAKPKPPGGMLSAPPKGPQWGWNNGQMGVTWKNGSFTGFGG